MKKILFLLLSAAVAVSAAAGVNLPPKRVDQDRSRSILPVDKNVKMDVKEKHQTVDDRMMTQPIKKALNATDDGRPEGHLKRYARSGRVVFYDSGHYHSATQSDTMDIVFALDGSTVYLKNILYGSNLKYGDYWVQGQLNADGTAISVPMGQHIYHQTSPSINIVLAWGTSTYVPHGLKEVFTFNVDTSVTQAVYLIEGETITLQNSFTTPSSSSPGYEGTGLGCIRTEDNSFGGFFEWKTVLTFKSFTPYLITEIPESCTVHLYKRNSGYVYLVSQIYSTANTTDGAAFRVAFDRDNQPDVYIQNPMWVYRASNVWVKGSYNRFTKIITIPTGQFLNWDGTNGPVLVWGHSYVDVGSDPPYDIFSIVDENVTEIKLKVDGDSLYLLNAHGDADDFFPYNYYSRGMMTYYSDGQNEIPGATCIEFCNHDTTDNELPWGVRINDGPAVPANPTPKSWVDWGDEYGSNAFWFNLPTTDVDGNLLNPEWISYSIYLDDDQLFTFDKETYSYLTEDITEVTYPLIIAAPDFHRYYCYFYRTNAEGYEPFFTWRIGVQAHYTVDGVKNSSEIAYLEVFDNPNINIGDVNMDNSISIADVTLLINYLLSEDSTGISLDNADINHDESITIGDVTALINMLLTSN